MQLGRCVERDYGYIGCASNVTRILASRCSGRRECIVVNFETLFAGRQTCATDLKAYLEAEYSCVNVTTGSQEQCQQGGEIRVTDQSGLLTSSIAQDLHLGSDLCPWRLVADEGQRFELSLWDFADYTKVDASVVSNPRYCRIYAFISEEKYTAVKDVVACNGQPSVQHVYTSRGHDVRVKFMVTPSVDPLETQHFAIKYRVLGCVLPSMPDHSHVVDHRNGSVTVQCNDTDQSYLTHCSTAGKYIGGIGNCSKSAGAIARDKEEGHFLSYGVAVVIIITVAILICALILTLGLVHYKRSRRRFDSRGHHVRLRHASSAPDAAEMKQMQTFSSARGHCNSLPATPKKQRYAVERSPMMKAKTLARTHSLNRGEYAHIWEIRRPIPVATPKVPPAGERSDPDGTTRSRSMERRPMEASGEEFPLPPNTFMTFKPLGDHVYESPRFASLSKSRSRSPGRAFFDSNTCTRDGKPIPPRRSLDQGDRNRLRTMGLGGTIQRVRYVPEPNPSEEGKITV
ncbi:hypothetical protein CAPTEDRAFT_219722 [Capitella teleta]|uniref:SUEL-type lectin domain-containing protein n=1 Tax=Capitella teleta TaxID=283909 RepID=R7V3K4_CAPTE|nr:hypothetical protein CAPTEDRAFT_219722 [Capitella teleta]|eukprot:ELU10385.1 hypothetical protein CAPTEDRAFT_219722 [Capitella teleta]